MLKTKGQATGRTDGNSKAVADVQGESGRTDGNSKAVAEVQGEGGGMGLDGMGLDGTERGPGTTEGWKRRGRDNRRVEEKDPGQQKIGREGARDGEKKKQTQGRAMRLLYWEKG